MGGDGNKVLLKSEKYLLCYKFAVPLHRNEGGSSL